MLRRFLVVLLIFCTQLSVALSEEVMQEQIARVSTRKGSVNIRKKPSKTAPIIGRLKNGILVEISGMEEDFYLIRFKQTEGYVAAEFLEQLDSMNPELKPGDQGEQVQALKERLMDLGFYKTGMNLNNQYNKACENRVRLFQRSNGIRESGIATQETLEILFSPTAKPKAKAPATKQRRTLVLQGRGSKESNVPAAEAVFGETFDWNQFAKDNPGVCMCCLGEGCSCCNFTGKIR